MKSESYSEIKNYYDNYSTWYHKERDRTYYYSFINEIEIDLIKEYAQGKTTLEIGSGTGIILNEVSKVSKESWGIDLSDGMVQRVKEKGLNVKQANATAIPFPDNTFDVVYSFKVLAHIPEIEKVISEVSRVLKDDGTTILEFYNPYSLKYLTNKLMRSQEKIFSRYDSLTDIRNYYKCKFNIISLRGARIITPFAGILKVPVLRKIIFTTEKALSRTFFNRAAGYFIVIAKKK